MLKAYKFRIYPTKSQMTKMEQILDLCRWTYNQTLAYRKNAWEKEGKSISKYETHNLLPTWKEMKPELGGVFSQTLQNVQERVDLALKAFFRRVKAGENPGYPRFRGRGWYDSFTYPQKGFKLNAGKLYLSKIGDIKIKLHRPIEGKIKRLTVRRAATGKWFACFTVEMEDQPKPPWKDGSLVGVDVGLESFATFSNGEKIANPRFFRKEEMTLTSYKAASAGSVVILVDPRNTSKMCSRCGILVEKTLSDRVHSCPQCGLSLDRDWNAAINILRLGLQSVGIKTVEACPF